MTKLLDLWVWVIEDDTGDSVATITDGGSFLPLIGDAERCEQLRPVAQQIADSTRRTVRLAQFMQRLDRGAVQPTPLRPT